MRINFPMALLDEAAPRCSPGDLDLDRKLSLIDRRAPFFLLYQTLTTLGHQVGAFAPGEGDLNIFWTAKQMPDSEAGRSIVMEVAWLPRTHYQISPSGSNHRGHYAASYVFAPLDAADASLMRRYVSRLRALYERRVSRPAVERLRATLPEEFVLFPLQLANDFNLKFSGTSFSRLYSPDGSNNAALARACVELTCGAPAGIPFVYKQHPFDLTEGLADLLPRGHVVVTGADDVSAHDIFATGRCRAVVAINSNTVHEAAVWNIPSICLGNLIWDGQSVSRPFAASIDALPDVLEARPLDDIRVLSYLHHLVRHQWTLTDFQNPLMVEELIRTRGACEPYALRQQWGLAQAA